MSVLVFPRRRPTLEEIDAVIEEMFAPKKCLRNRGVCECGHIAAVHGGSRVAAMLGACHGTKCACEKFVPKSYAKEQEAARNKLRAFALRILERPV